MGNSRRRWRLCWGEKPGQERVLAVRMSRRGFEEALSMACLSHVDRDVYADAAQWAERKGVSPVRVQWDPERSPTLEPLAWRSLQMGLGGVTAERYADEWVLGLEDATERGHAVRDGDLSALPAERPYPLPAEVARVIGASRDDDQVNVSR